MKPLYIVIVLWSLIIWLLADGIGGALEAIPAIGTILGFVVTFCINATMGAGFLYLLITNGMYHPRFGQFFIIGSLIPGIDFLPFWLGLGLAGIAQDMQKEKGLTGALGSVAGAALSAQSGKNPLQSASALTKAAGAFSRPQAANDNAQGDGAAEDKARAPLNLKSPSMSGDIAPKRPANDNHHYVQKAA